MRQATDLTNKQCGLWTPLYRVENGRHGKTQWMCQCVCGAKKVVTTNSLVTNNSTSCGCNNTRDLTGQTFGDVKVVGPDYSCGRRAWRCLCRCGTVSVMSCGMLCRKSHTTCGATERCQTARRTETQLVGPQTEHRILVVDDDDELCTTLGEAFRDEGWTTSWRTSALDALGLALERDFDVIVTDLMMPFMNGIELCERVLVSKPNTSVVVITGNASIRGAVDSVHAGAFDYVAKPFNICDLFQTVDRAMKRKRQALMTHVEAPALAVAS